MFFHLDKHQGMHVCVAGLAAILCLSACDDGTQTNTRNPGDAAIARPYEPKVRKFDSVYEPSGVRLLTNGKILVIEDEAQQPLSILSFEANGNAIRTPLKITGKRSAGRLEDLEGVSGDDAGHLYVITSHSKTEKHCLPSSRTKLIRYKIDDYSLGEAFVIRDVKKQILRQYAEIKKNISGRKDDLNFEALSYHRQDRKLMIGLRTPLVKDKAVIVVVENTDQAFAAGEKIRLADKLIKLELDKGGIRAMAYDKILGGYLILSRREDKKNKSFKLWLWDGKISHQPHRINIHTRVDLDNAEGVSPIQTESMAGILLTFDDGDFRKGKGGHYILVPYEQLSIDGA